MIFSIVIILLVGLIGYIHYVQGLLSGLISAVLAICAAMIAIGYYEPVADSLSGGKYNDTAQGLCLVALFLLVYLVGRLLFDKLVPGNIRLPHLVDAIGGAVCGVIAGCFALGIIAIAFQSMPFGASIFGYTRYPLSSESERHVSIPGVGGRNVDRTIYDELKNNDLEKEPESLLIPVDDIVVGTARHLSAGGSLAGSKEFEAIHPNLVQELFGQRIGIESGAKHTIAAKSSATVEGANVINVPLKKTVGEYKEIHKDEVKGNLTPDARKFLVSVTVMFKKDAADEDNRVRLSPGAVRLVAKSDEGWRNYFPLGTVQQGQAWLNKPDDPLFIDLTKEDRGAHFLFEVDQSVIVGNPDAKPQPGKPAAEYAFAPESFIEIKRLKLSLDGVKVALGPPTDAPKYFPMRKTKFYSETADPNAPQQPTASNDAATPAQPAQPPAAAPGTPSAENGWLEAPLQNPVLTVSNQLPIAINPGTNDADGDVATTAIDGQLTGKKFSALNVDLTQPGSAVTELPKGTGTPIKELFVPEGMRLLQVKMTLKPGGDPWAWPTINDYTVADDHNEFVPCRGVYATVTDKRTQKFLAHYKAIGTPTVNKLEGATLSEVTLLFLYPKDKKAHEIQYRNQKFAGGLSLEK